MSFLLHKDNFDRMKLSGGRLSRWLEARSAQLDKELGVAKDPGISIVIRTRNDGRHIERLFADIKAQIFGGAIQIIVVDTESRDQTVSYAKSQGAKVISLLQKDFSYPLALNLGFREARHEWVVTLVGHSSLCNRLMFRSLTYWASQENKLGGIYGLPLPNWNASFTERNESALWPWFWKGPRYIAKRSMGVMGANCSIVNRAVWERCGGYDERYAGGGEDVVLAQAMLDRGAVIVREPLCSVFHSHGLSFKDGVRQWQHWMEVGKMAQPFETKKVHDRRPDLR
jgi:rhamnosyltransferase